MKKVLMIVLPVALLILGGVAYLTQAEEDPSGLSREDRLFLIETVDARMMDWAEGNLAAERGSNEKYRIYGRRMMRDQDKLMKELRGLAERKNLALPDEISEDKMEGLTSLKKVSGETFDRRFRRMIIKDHKRDIRLFKKASESPDPEISSFAKQHLSLLEEHLEQARALNQ